MDFMRVLVIQSFQLLKIGVVYLDSNTSEVSLETPPFFNFKFLGT